MKLLLTGSSGFIGTYFIDHYRKKYDIFTFSFQNDDLDTLALREMDTIIHLSALVHQMEGAPYEEYVRVNVKQTLDLAHKAKEDGVKHFIFMSSVKVYGEETYTAYTETTPCEPQDDYGISKFEAENQLSAMEDENFTVSIIRTPIVYGYGVKANIQSLINLIKKIPILPLGSIQNKRTMVYIGNLCALLDKISETQKRGIFLAGDDHSISTSDLINLIAKELNKTVYLIKIPFFESLLKQFKPSFHKRLYESLEVNNHITKEILNFDNPYSVEEGIHLMIHGENR